jgi:hypothetical protein
MASKLILRPFAYAVSASLFFAVAVACSSPANGPETPEANTVSAPLASTPQSLEDEGFERILRQRDNGRFNKAGWNHYGPGYFELDTETGVLASHGGMGLMWYAAQDYGDFILDLEFMTEVADANSGVFVRVPGVPSSDEYIYHSWEIQIDDASEGIHQTGAVYDAEAPTRLASKGPGEWNRMRITFVGNHITVEVNGEKVVDWEAEPRGKVADFAERGYIGLQNHDRDTRTFFRNIFVKSLD